VVTCLEFSVPDCEAVRIVVSDKASTLDRTRSCGTPPKSLPISYLLELLPTESFKLKKLDDGTTEVPNMSSYDMSLFDISC
jgi:hypothetical protein